MMVHELEKAFEAAQRLPEEGQRTLAAVISQEIDGNERWRELFADPRSERLLEQLIAEAQEEDRQGLTTPVDPQRL